MKTQVKVVKADGSIEQYLHTKVLGTVNHALAGAEVYDLEMAEQLTEAVTYYLYHQLGKKLVSSCEIFSMVTAVLASTGYEDAAEYLITSHHRRKVNRSRIEVVPMSVTDLAVARQICEGNGEILRHRWDKSRIVTDLVKKHGIDLHTARTVASLVEEKILQTGLSTIPTSLIEQLVWTDAAAVLNCQNNFQQAATA